MVTDSIPTKVGIQTIYDYWIPASAGMVDISIKSQIGIQKNIFKLLDSVLQRNGTHKEVIIC